MIAHQASTVLEVRLSLPETVIQAHTALERALSQKRLDCANVLTTH